MVVCSGNVGINFFGSLSIFDSCPQILPLARLTCNICPGTNSVYAMTMKISQPCPTPTSRSAGDSQTDIAPQDDIENPSFTEAKHPGDALRPLRACRDIRLRAAANRKPPPNGTYLQMASSVQLMARNARSVHRSITSFQESAFYSSLPLVSFLYIIGAAAVIPTFCKGQ